MDIGTAKATPEEMEGIPHHLISIVEPTEVFNVGRWLEAAESCIQDIQSRDRIPIVCGGTHMYINSLMHQSLTGVPSGDAETRRALEELDPIELHDRLRQVDPEAALKIHPNNKRRVVRALEVFQHTGKSISELQTHWDQGWRDDANVIALHVDKEAINARINYRVTCMMDQNFEQEVHNLWQSNQLGRTARSAIGYSHFCDYFEGKKYKGKRYRGLLDVEEEIKIDSRRFAKKQRTWMKRMCGLHRHVQSISLEAPQLSHWKTTQSIECLALSPSSEALLDLLTH